jgi:hypothetical protein
MRREAVGSEDDVELGPDADLVRRLVETGDEPLITSNALVTRPEYGPTNAGRRRLNEITPRDALYIQVVHTPRHHRVWRPRPARTDPRWVAAGGHNTKGGTR